MLQDERHIVGGDEGIGKAEADEDAARRAVHQAQRCFEHGDAGAFAADQRARDVEAILRKQLVEVVAGDAAGNFREALANERRVRSRMVSQAGVDFSRGGRRGDDVLGEFARRRLRRPSCVVPS